MTGKSLALSCVAPNKRQYNLITVMYSSCILYHAIAELIKTRLISKSRTLGNSIPSKAWAHWIDSLPWVAVLVSTFRADKACTPSISRVSSTTSSPGRHCRNVHKASTTTLSGGTFARRRVLVLAPLVSRERWHQLVGSRPVQRASSVVHEQLHRPKPVLYQKRTCRRKRGVANPKLISHYNPERGWTYMRYIYTYIYIY